MQLTGDTKVEYSCNVGYRDVGIASGVDDFLRYFGRFLLLLNLFSQNFRLGQNLHTQILISINLT